MPEEQWIVIPNWGTFQHYSERTPIWIKVYLELRDRDEWEALSYAQRGLLTTIWIEYAAHLGTLAVHNLPSKRHLRVRRTLLDSLVRAGFIQLSASKPLAQEKKLEKNKQEGPALTRLKPVDNPRPRPSSVATTSTNPARANVVAKDPAYALERMIRNGVIQSETELDAELRGYKVAPDGELAAKLRRMLDDEAR